MKLKNFLKKEVTVFCIMKWEGLQLSLTLNSLVNSIVPNYLVALQSSLLPTNTSPGNTPHNCRAVWDDILNLRGAILCTLTSLPCPRMPLSMWKRKHPAFSLRCVRNLWLGSHYVSPCTPADTLCPFGNWWAILEESPKTSLRQDEPPQNELTPTFPQKIKHIKIQICLEQLLALGLWFDCSISLASYSRFLQIFLCVYAVFCN